MRTVDPLSEAERAAFIAAARAMMNWPWRHQGRTERGIDCLGFVKLAISTVRAVVDREGYGRTPYNRQLRASLVEHFGPPVADLQPADIVSMAWTGEERHLAIVTDYPEGLGLIHCYARAPGGRSGGRVVEHRLDESWRRNIIEAFRP